MPVVVQECITEPPPRGDSVHFDECDGWEACLDFNSAGNLIRYLRDVKTWMDDAYFKCGPFEENENDRVDL